MAKIIFTQDLNLPSHGRRTKAQNTGTIRVHIHRGSTMFLTMNPDAFDIYLNIDLSAQTYHATVEAEYCTGQSLEFERHVFDVEVSSDILAEVIELAHDEEFMALKIDDIFPGISMLDGRDIEISIQGDNGKLSLSENTLEDTLANGLLPTTNKVFETPFDRLADIGFKTLGIEPERSDEEES